MWEIRKQTNINFKKHIVMLVLSEHVQDAGAQFFLHSEEVCGGGLEDYSSEAQGASHRTLQWLVYSVIISVKWYGEPEVGMVERFVFVILQR